MKTQPLIACLCIAWLMTLSIPTIHAQKLDVKKDFILKDKILYAKVTGSIGMFKPANLLVSSLNGDSLFTIKRWSYPTDNPQFMDLSGFEIRFIGSGKTLIKSSRHDLISKEQVIEFILRDRDFSSTKRENEYNKDLIVNNAVDATVEAEFIEQFNSADAIRRAQIHEAKEIETLKTLFPLKRDVNQPVSLKPAQSTPTTQGHTQTIEIYQDSSHLATITKDTKLSMSMGSSYVYTFHRMLEKPFEVEDKKVYKVFIATVKIGGAFPKMYVNVKGKEQDIKIVDSANAERELVDILIKNRYL